MADLALGTAPLSLDVLLPRDADFIATLTRDDDVAWADTATVFLQFNFRNAPAQQWDAELDGASVLFNVDKVEVNAVLDARPSNVKLWFIDGDVEVLWASGKVKTA